MSLISVNDVLKITTRVEKIHPYKVVGDRDSYSPYNEGWSDCVSLIEHYLEQIPYAEPEQTAKVEISDGWFRCCRCDYCTEHYSYDWKFCPACGAKLDWSGNE